MVYSCGIVPVRFVDGRPQYLLLSNHSHWDFPKGCVEGDETHFSCALREFEEESGIPASELNFKWGKPSKYYDTEPYSKKPKKIARYYVAEVSAKSVVKIAANPKTGIVEHDNFGWFNYNSANSIVKPRIQKALDFARNIVEPK